MLKVVSAIGRRLKRRWSVLAAAVLIGVAPLSSGNAQNAAFPEGTVIENAQIGSIGPGRRMQVSSEAEPRIPSAALIASRAQIMAAKAKHLAPPLGPHTTAANVPAYGGPPTYAAEPASNTFTVFKQSLINSICSGCGEATVNEPSAANSGKFILETSNWNIAYSLSGSSNPIVWKNEDPYTLSSGYCCDTQVVYNADRDVFILLLLDYAGEGASTNGFTLSISRGQTPTSWCTYKFNGSFFGEGATDTLDYAKLALANNNLFVTWNDYPPNAGFVASGLARFPLDSLAACAGFGFNYLARSDVFTLALAQQPSAHDTFYFVSNWFLDGTTNGQNERIFSWPDNSGSYGVTTRGVNAYPFGTVACGSPNWCSRLDERYESVVITPAEYRAQANSAFAGDQVLEIATQAGPSNFSNGNNYVVYNYFKLNSLSYIGNDQTYSTSETFAYAGCAVNQKGYVGCALSQGLNAPGGLILLQDNVSPTQPWGFDFVVNGISGASGWGDYNETNVWLPSAGPFQTVAWNVNGNTVQPYYIVWGRGSDANGYNRWKNK